MEEALALVARRVHDILIDTPTGMRNVTEWAKKQACWHRVKELHLDWPRNFVSELVSLEEDRERKREGRKDQELLNGIEAQTAVFSAGGAFWKQTMDWGKRQNVLSERDLSLLRTASLIPGKIPTEKQAKSIYAIYSRMRIEGFENELPYQSGQQNTSRYQISRLLSDA